MLHLTKDTSSIRLSVGCPGLRTPICTSHNRRGLFSALELKYSRPVGGLCTAPGQDAPESNSITTEPQQAQSVQTDGRKPKGPLHDPPDWSGFLGTLASSGATTGTLLDGIHSRVGLQVYDTLPIVAGGLNTSLAVPPLLALFYLVLGTLFPVCDNLFPSEQTDKAYERSRDVGFVALSFGVLAVNLQISAWLYSHDLPFSQIFAVLAALSLVNWKVFDDTKQGLLLAVVCALGAPAAELVLLQIWPLWHYPKADVLGMVSWVPWCYFFYTPAIGNLARFTWQTSREIPWQSKT